MRGGAALAGTANSAQSYLGRNDHPLRVNLRVVSVRYQQRALSRREAGPGGCATLCLGDLQRKGWVMPASLAAAVPLLPGGAGGSAAAPGPR